MQAFAGIRVLDFTHVLAGPFCTYQLAVMGADVIKIEAPANPDMMRPLGPDPTLNEDNRGGYFVSQSSNKRSVSIDMATPEGLDIIRELVKSVDVLVENFRGGVMARHGLDYDDVRALNPGIIYCSMTGFGHTGPKANHPAYDNVIQAFSGLMAATGSPENNPVRVGPPVLDYGTGAQAAFAVASALYQRTHTGEGQHIDVAMTDAAMMLMSTNVIDAQVYAQSPVPYGNVNRERPGYSLFATADGELMIGAFTLQQKKALWRALGREDIAGKLCADNPQAVFTDADHELAELDGILQLRTAAEWEDILMAAGIPAARVRRVDEALDHEQIMSRHLLQAAGITLDSGEQLQVPVAAFSYAKDGPSIRTPAPKPGEHTAEVLKEIGMDNSDIARLCDQGVIATHS